MPTTPAPKTIGTPGGPVRLPSWKDAQSVTSYLTSLLAVIAGVLSALHPGWHEPAIVQAVVPSVAALIAGVTQVANVLSHRSVIKAAVGK